MKKRSVFLLALFLTFSVNALSQEKRGSSLADFAGTLMETPCSESIVMAGHQQVDWHSFVGPSGNFHFKVAFTPGNDLMGIGMETGLRYNASGMEKQSYVGTSQITASTAIGNFRLTAPGGNWISVRVNYRWRWNELGEVKLGVDRYEVNCHN